ncbi:MAG: hypothetical protein VSS75_007210, partial [Candidatus Parabeggiatoa sp.]|nr:hypothetical protein [Candidatus Parabeggiatoa sp.]
MKKLNLMAMRHLAEATEWVSLAEKIKQEESTQSMASTSKSPRAEKLLTLLMTTLMGGVGYGAKWLVFQLGVTLDEVLA